MCACESVCIFMYVCKCTYICLCSCVHMHDKVNVWSCVCLRAGVCACVRVCKCVRAHVRMSRCAYAWLVLWLFIQEQSLYSGCDFALQFINWFSMCSDAAGRCGECGPYHVHFGRFVAIWQRIAEKCVAVYLRSRQDFSNIPCRESEKRLCSIS